MFGALILGAMCSIIHSSDGGVDDFATTALIAAAEEKQMEDIAFDFPAVIITNADCEPISAFSACLKTVKALNMKTQAGLSSSRVWTQFPWVWRAHSHFINELSFLHGHEVDHNTLQPNGNHLFVEVLNSSQEVKIVATGPLTTIADVFKAHPDLIQKVTELHWMGGALDIPGNIMDSPEIPKNLLNENAEWNVFADPESADWIFRNTSFAIYIYPLDISDKTYPNDFMNILNRKNASLHSRYVSDCYQLVENIPEYRMWDVVAAAGVLFPHVLQPPVKENLRVETGFKNHGAFFRDNQGREVFVYKAFKDNDPNHFYEAVANTLSGK